MQFCGDFRRTARAGHDEHIFQNVCHAVRVGNVQPLAEFHGKDAAHFRPGLEGFREQGEAVRQFAVQFRPDFLLIRQFAYGIGLHELSAQHVQGNVVQILPGDVFQRILDVVGLTENRVAFGGDVKIHRLSGLHLDGVGSLEVDGNILFDSAANANAGYGSRERVGSLFVAGQIPVVDSLSAHFHHAQFDFGGLRAGFLGHFRQGQAVGNSQLRFAILDDFIIGSVRDKQLNPEHFLQPVDLRIDNQEDVFLDGVSGNVPCFQRFGFENARVAGDIFQLAELERSHAVIHVLILRRGSVNARGDNFLFGHFRDFRLYFQDVLRVHVEGEVMAFVRDFKVEGTDLIAAGHGGDGIEAVGQIERSFTVTARGVARRLILRVRDGQNHAGQKFFRLGIHRGKVRRRSGVHDGDGGSRGCGFPRVVRYRERDRVIAQFRKGMGGPAGQGRGGAVAEIPRIRRDSKIVRRGSAVKDYLNIRADLDFLRADGGDRRFVIREDAFDTFAYVAVLVSGRNAERVVRFRNDVQASVGRAHGRHRRVVLVEREAADILIVTVPAHHHVLSVRQERVSEGVNYGRRGVNGNGCCGAVFGILSGNGVGVVAVGNVFQFRGEIAVVIRCHRRNGGFAFRNGDFIIGHGVAADSIGSRVAVSAAGAEVNRIHGAEK